ncbi:MAG TPA: ATP-binding protein [Deltaproteobacteria bacterium]|nr:ATP-binding protein [Deltaproteobacteria bacterium]
MPQMRRRAGLEYLEELIAFVAGHAETAGFPPSRIREIELAAEEALVNVFKYAYPETGGDVVVNCGLTDEGRLQLEISDRGIPFNMLHVPDPDLTADIPERRIGGLGIFFIKKMTDEARYQRQGKTNNLTLIFDKRD